MHSPDLYRSAPSSNAPGAVGQQTPIGPNLVLAICCLSLLLVGMNVTIVNVALPAIQHDLHARLSGLQWILDAYTLVVSSLLMLSGSMSDRFGRRRVFKWDWFFSPPDLCCAVSRTPSATLSIIANVFKEPKDRARAIGIWGAVAGVSLALGPLLGGVLTQAVGWRSIFWINLPVGLAAVPRYWHSAHLLVSPAFFS